MVNQVAEKYFFPPYIEPEDTMPYSQKPATGCFRQLNQVHTLTSYFFMINFNSLPTYIQVSQMLLIFTFSVAYIMSKKLSMSNVTFNNMLAKAPAVVIIRAGVA
jgi:hypothetical protein